MQKGITATIALLYQRLTSNISSVHNGLSIFTGNNMKRGYPDGEMKIQIHQTYKGDKQMALVINIRMNSTKPIKTRDITYMDIGMDQTHFAMWTYRSSDPERQLPSSQNIQLKRDEAIVLLNALNAFLKK